MDETKSSDVPMAVSSPSSSIDDIRPEAVGGDSIEDLPPHYYRKPRVIASILSLALGYQAAWLAYPMIFNILYTVINVDIGPDPDVIWVNLAFGLTQTIVYVILGRASDLFGRRWFAITGNALCVIGYLICSRAHSIKMVIGGMTIAGFGYGAQLGCLYIAVPELVPHKYRFTVVGFSMSFLSPFSSISTAIARLFSTNTEQGWRWVFYFLAIISGVACILQVTCYFPPDFHLLHKTRTKRDALRKFDYGGLFIFIGSATSILLGLSWGGQKYPWASGQVIGTIVAGGVGLIGFFIWEKFWAGDEPLVPLYLFTRLNYVALGVCATVASLTYWALSLIWPLQIQFLFGASDMQVGWKSSTLSGGASCGQVLAALLVKRIGKTKWQLVTAAVVFTSFIGGMAGVTSHTENMAIAFSILSSICIGYTEVFTLVAAPMIADDKDIGVASGVEMFFRSGLSTFAGSLYTTIYSNKISNNLMAYVGAAVLKSGLTSSTLPTVLTAITAGTPAALHSIPGMTPQIFQAIMSASITAYKRSFAVIYLTSIAFGGCSIIAALLTTNIDGKLTSKVSRRLKGVTRTGTISNAKEQERGVDEESIETIEI
ncbi:hypothetical protein RBB50_012787 [Rhinocladiella similis]